MNCHRPLRLVRSQGLFWHAVLVSLFIGLASALALGQALAPKVQTPNQAEAPQELRKQNDLLRGQLDVMKQYHQGLLTTVYWALGGIVTLMGILVGFGWFANFRVYERDKNALAVELRGVVAQELAKLASALEEKMAAQSRELDKTTADVFGRLTKLVEDGRREIEKSIETSEQAVGRTAKADTLHLEVRVNELGNAMINFRYALLEDEARRWKAEDIIANVLRTHTEMLRVAVQHSHLDWRVPGLHDQLRGVLNKAMQTRRGHLISAESIGELNGLFEKVPAAHAVSIAGLRELLGQLHRSQI